MCAQSPTITHTLSGSGKGPKLVAKVPPRFKVTSETMIVVKSPLGEVRENQENRIVNGKERRYMLHWAASQGLTTVVENIISSEKISCNQVDRCGRTALHWTAEEGHSDAARALLRAGVSVNSRSRHNITPLMLAAMRGHVKMVCLLLEAGASVPGRSQEHASKIRRPVQWKSTALHYAAAGGHVGVVSLLLDAGFDKEQRDEAGLTPVEIFTRSSHSSTTTIYRLLPSDRGARMVHDYVNMVTEDVEIVAGLAEGGAFLDWQDDIGDAPLHRATHFRHIDTAKALISHGAGTDIRNRRGGAPLHVASSNGCVEIAAALLENGADTESRMVNGRSPLHLAAINNKLEVVKLLLQAGAYTEHRDRSRGQTPLSEASEYCLVPVIRALLKAGANVEARSLAGITPLHWACRFTSPDTVEALLAGGADPDAVDEAAAKAALSATPILGCFNYDLSSSIDGGTCRPAAADVIGLGDPSGSKQNSPYSFFEGCACAVQQRKDQGSVKRIRVVLQRAKRDRAWRRRGWLVMMAKRGEVGVIVSSRLKGRGQTTLKKFCENGPICSVATIGDHDICNFVDSVKEKSAAGGINSLDNKCGGLVGDTTGFRPQQERKRAPKLERFRSEHLGFVKKRLREGTNLVLSQAIVGHQYSTASNREFRQGRACTDRRTKRKKLWHVLKSRDNDGCYVEVVKMVLGLATLEIGVFRTVIGFV